MSDESPALAAPAARSPRAAYRDLFLISFLILFLELACIRWFGSTVPFLTFFTNLVLMACFLGMSVGCLVASRRYDYIRTVLPLTLLTLLLSCVVYYVQQRLGRVLIEVNGPGSPQQVFFGTEAKGAKDPGQFIVPIELVASLVFILVALMFLGLGQVLGRAFDAIPNRVAAYTVNILASLAGIVAFGVMSWLWIPPILWFGLSVAIVLWFLPRSSWPQTLSALGILTGIGLFSDFEAAHWVTIWSPYYKVHYDAKNALIITNNIGHQGMMNIHEQGSAYLLPHLLNRDAGNQPFESVMVIGAGSGNDVAAALASGARHIDAVEIDPVLNRIGRHEHPLRPYDDPRVAVHLDDGRSFARQADRPYDLTVYALVDSLVLHSGYSNLRLESFLFTEQAFEDIRSRLGPDGVFVMYNAFRQGWIVDRLEQMITKVFGVQPLVISLPYRATVEPDDSLQGSLTMVIAGLPGSRRLEAIQRQFQEHGTFWLSQRPSDNESVNGFSVSPHSGKDQTEHWQKIAPSRVEDAEVGPLPTDDWPFLYVRGAIIPGLTLRHMALIAVLSLALLLGFAPARTLRPNGQMFFLGAGFMLLETKGVVHLALLFGATWMVNSIVFFVILEMILLSNLFVLAFRPRVLWPFYLLLIGSLLANYEISMNTFLGLSGPARVIASCAVVFVPIFFAGVIFATVFRDSQRPDLDYGSNIGGVILGGLSENLSLVLGFDRLLLVVVGFYVLSALLGKRR